MRFTITVEPVDELESDNIVWSCVVQPNGIVVHAETNKEALLKALTRLLTDVGETTFTQIWFEELNEYYEKQII